jgi:UDP-N-acetyl-D-glucosamine dehydrogenase
VSSPTVAEMTKLLENTFRQINIGLVNEIAIICDKLGINALEVIDAASTKPFGFMTFFPGPGIGGHCIPVDPIYLSWKMKSLNYRARFIELATDINAEMPGFWVDKIQQALNQKRKSLKGARLLVIGVTYKKDIDDVRESPVLEILQLLIERGAAVDYYDPYVPNVEVNGKKLKSVKFSPGLVKKADCVVIATDHSVIDYKMIRAKAGLVVDTRGVYHRLGKKT